MGVSSTSVTKMFAELDQLNAKFIADASDLTICFKSMEGEQCVYHMYNIATKDISQIKALVLIAAKYLEIEILSFVAHSHNPKT